MDLQAIYDASILLDKIKIPKISGETSFWMIRSKAGYFYTEYIKKEFIALGWNYIDSSTSFDGDNIETLKDAIKERYGDKIPMTSINKCKRFIYELKEGDYVVIPNEGSTEIAICIIGEYFEDSELDYLKELAAIRKIENGECEINSILCPYKKRRKIIPLLKVSTQRVGYKLLRAISSYHGLSNMNECAEDILNCVYNCYEYRDDLIYAINIAKNERIKARELSTLLYTTTELFCKLIDEDLLSVTINVNSPGKYVVRLEKGYQKLKKGSIPLIMLYLLIFGGSAFGFEFSGALDSIIDAIKEIRMIDIEVETARVELENKKLENYNKTIELIESVKESEIGYDDLKEKIETISKLGKTLQFQSNKEFAVVNDRDKKNEGDGKQNNNAEE